MRSDGLEGIADRALDMAVVDDEGGAPGCDSARDLACDVVAPPFEECPGWGGCRGQCKPWREIRERNAGSGGVRGQWKPGRELSERNARNCRRPLPACVARDRAFVPARCATFGLVDR